MAKVPYRALSFLGNVARRVATNGARGAVANAAAKVSPPLMVIEAAVSVLGAVGSFIDLASARKTRDGLAEVNASLCEKLSLKREALAEAIDVARTQLADEARVREVLQGVVRLCADAFSESMRTCAELLTHDLPDVDLIERQQEKMQKTWGTLQRALNAYQLG